MKHILRPTMLSIFWLQGHHSLKDSPTWESVLIAHCNLHTFSIRSAEGTRRTAPNCLRLLVFVQWSGHRQLFGVGSTVTQHFLGVRVRHILGLSATEVGGYIFLWRQLHNVYWRYKTWQLRASFLFRLRILWIISTNCIRKIHKFLSYLSLSFLIQNY